MEKTEENQTEKQVEDFENNLSKKELNKLISGSVNEAFMQRDKEIEQKEKDLQTKENKEEIEEARKHIKKLRELHDDWKFIDGVPKKLYDFFKVKVPNDNEVTIKKLQTLWEWAIEKDDYKDFSNKDNVYTIFQDNFDKFEKAVSKISSGIVRLGSPSSGEYIFDKLYKKIAIRKYLEDTGKH